MDDRRARAEAIESFAATLRELRNAVGNPPFREMSGKSGAISHTTLHEATKGNRLPSWETTVEFVKACDADPAAYRERWEAANRTVRSVSTGDPATRAPAAPPSGELAASAAGGQDLRAAHLATGSPAIRPTGETQAPDFPPSPPGHTNHAPLRDTQPPSGHAGDVPPPSGHTNDARPPSGHAGDGQQSPPAPGSRGRRWLTRPVALTAAAVVVAGAAVLVVTVVNSGSEPAGRAPSPTGGASPAALTPADCPVRSTNPPWAPPLYEDDKAEFITDVTLSDCTRVGADQTMTKVWRLKNAGSVAWKGYSLRRLDHPTQQADQCQTIPDVPIKDTMPGEIVDIQTVVTTPKKPGLCYVRFKMVDASGEVVFPGNRPINFQLIVAES
ncbi:NBR1-Ig-like domain-containing protein [Nonomuraea fuscirosea]|uniref:NBR1-Ig-like domain-containing protein n=1 Tax=Nonomuraea fuscirosea TaxID=1291556 RepID=UPI00343C732D